jgi:hypothetical protein
MPNFKTGNLTHDANCLAAEQTRAAAVAAASSQAAVTAAEVQFYKTCRDSAFNNGLPHAQFMEALRQLGVPKVNPLAP